VSRRRVRGGLANLARLASLAVLATACDSLLTKPLMYTSVQVHTELLDGSPVAGVQLELYTGQRVMALDSTNSAGLALFQFVPAGPAYGVLAVAPAGYEFPEVLPGGPPTNYIDGFALSVDSTPHFTFRLLLIACYGAISVTVVDATGAAVSGASLLLYSAENQGNTTSVETGGTVTFGNLYCGIERGVMITPPAGWTAMPGRGGSYFDGLLVTSGGTVNVKFTLTRAVP
jgi:hypothetical protein